MSQQVDDCVESVLEDNPDYDRSRAYAICKAQFELDGEVGEVVELGEVDLESEALDTLAKQSSEWKRHDDETVGVITWIDTESGSVVYEETTQPNIPDGVLLSGLSQEALESIQSKYNVEIIDYQSDIPDDAVSISDRDEAPEGANVVTGPRGGLYYVPNGEDVEEDEDGAGVGRETTSSNPFQESPEEVFNEIAPTEEIKENVQTTTRHWVGWPTDSNTKPIWTAAAEITDNQNDPGDITGSPLVDEFDADPEAVESYIEYKENLEEKLREEHGDTITAHRFIHGGTISGLEEGSPEVVERLKDGDSVQPRTLGSWTTDRDLIPGIVEGVAPDASEEAIENAVVIEMDIPVDNVMDHHAANPELEDGGQEEVIASLDWSDSLSDGEVTPLSEVME